MNENNSFNNDMSECKNMIIELINVNDKLLYEKQNYKNHIEHNKEIETKNNIINNLRNENNLITSDLTNSFKLFETMKEKL
jgi:hypothetical protein